MYFLNEVVGCRSKRWKAGIPKHAVQVLYNYVECVSYKGAIIRVKGGKVVDVMGCNQRSKSIGDCFLKNESARNRAPCSVHTMELFVRSRSYGLRRQSDDQNALD